MKTKQLGNSDLYITPIGFGAWAIGGSGWEFAWGEQDDKASIGAIHRSLELGVNWIDTAAVYGMGHSEGLVGAALKSWSGPRPYVFTKCGLLWNDEGHVRRSLDADSIRRDCENSLRRLKVDRIDLYQIHWPTEDLEEGWGEMALLQKEGKVRWIGVSNFDAGQMRRAAKIAPVTSVQPPYSLIRREIEADVLPYSHLHNIGVIVYSPMQSGLLTGAMTRERIAKLPDGDWRGRDPEFREPRLSKNLKLVDRLRGISGKYGRPVGQVAVAWVLRNPAVTAAIVGARSPQQVEQNVGAAELDLTDDDVAEIEGVGEHKANFASAA
jgi:aryl-alcohol dehydrogenase-like predicted oxidoreductase